MPLKVVIKYLKIRNLFFYSLFLITNIILAYAIFNSSVKFFLFKTSFQYTYIKDRCENAYVADLEKDGNQDVVALYSDEPLSHRKVLGIFSPFSPSALHRVKYFTENLLYSQDILAPPEDIDGDGKAEILIIQRKNNGIVLKVMDLKGGYKSSLNFEDPLKEGQFFISDIFFEDLENDGKKELILPFESAWSALPRGVLALSTSGKVLWIYSMGCSPVSVKAVDIDRDGKKEIIISGRGTHNGVFANETDDEHSYIIVLNYRGERLWLKTLGGYYTSLFFDISDIDNDFEPEIVVSKNCHRVFEPEPGEIMIIKSKNGEIHKRFSKSGISFSNIYNLDEENKYFVVGSSSGEVSIFDRNLNKIKSVVLEYPSIVRGIGKMGRDDTQNYVFVQSGFTNFCILNSNLKRVHKFSFKDFPGIDWLKFYPIKSKDEFAGILNADNLYLIKKKPYNLLTAFLGFFSSSLALYLLVFVIFNFSILTLRWGRVQKKSHEITEESIETAQEIAHSMKNPMFTIQLEAEKIAKFVKEKEPENINISTAVKSILEDVKSLKELIRVFMKILVPKPLNLKRTDLNLLIQKIVQKYSEILKGEVRFILDLENEPPFMLIDEEQMEEALTNLILNSIEALTDGGEIKISSTIVYSPILKNKKGIEIEIEDNGIGIPKDKISEIFKPYYTTKREGYGIGLTMTKRIIEAHGGKINVYSKEGIGTRFAIFLPWKGE